ncbi:MAG: tetratricopeptide repeat protein, partial [Nocardioides sp.]
MTSPSPTVPLTSDDPEAYVAEDRRWALAGGEPVDGRRSGTTLFADVSGFTALTEALADELGPERGAEELTGVLERVFHALIATLHDVGGSVVYFSGDAITAWLDGDAGLRAVSCAFAMQETMDRVGVVVSPGGKEVRLGVKVAVALGQARRFVVGDPSIQLLDVLAGSLMDEVAAAEGTASPGEVVVTKPVLAALGASAVGAQLRDGALGPVAALTAVEATPEPWVNFADSAPLSLDEVRKWLLPAIFERVRTNRGDFVAELRPAVPMFFKFTGIDFDADDDSPQLLDNFIVAAQRIVDGYGGSLLQITVGDKGAYLYAVFGSPEAHGDDAARACAAALDVLTLQDDTITGISIGIAAGRLRSGTYGHRRRRTFCCLGDAVNLAARLMSKAPIGGVMVSDSVRRAALDVAEFSDVELLTLKGKARSVPAARLLRGRDPHAGGRRLQLMGRDDELALLLERVHETRETGSGGLIGVCGGAGIGTSRLIAEVVERARESGTTIDDGTARAHRSVGAYSAWWGIARGLLDVRDDMDAHELADHLDRLLPPDLRPRAPLLGGLLGMPLPDNDLTASLEAKLRKTSLEQLAEQLLVERVVTPHLIVLDDAHLMEPLGRDLLVAISHAIRSLPITLLLGYRRGAEALLGLAVDPELAQEVVLPPLEPAQTTALAVAELTRLSGDGAAIPPALIALAVERSDGNPLWVRELCRYLHDRSRDSRAPSEPAVDALDLPATLHGLVLNRLDQLPEAPRRAAKVASVVGTSFSGRLVQQSYPELGAADDLRHSLQELERREVARPLDQADSWAFTHALLHDVAYESLPFALRSQLHDRIADAILAGASGDPERQLDDLAHHCWHGGDDAKKREHLRKAGDAASAAYANDAALLHYRRLLTLLPTAEQTAVLVRIGKILELQTEWRAAADAFRGALEAARAAEDEPGAAWAQTWLADVARKQGHFEDATTGLESAAQAFTHLDDQIGMAQVRHLQGTLAAQRGDLPLARSHYEASLAQREALDDRHGMAALYSNLAIVAEYESDYELAEDLAGRGLELRRELGDRRGIAVSQNNLGMLATLRGDPSGAQARFAESMALATEVGDTWMVALGHHNLGNAARDLDQTDQASASYRTALDAYRRYDDDWVLALLYEDVALLAGATGRAHDAWQLVGCSDA